MAGYLTRMTEHLVSVWSVTNILKIWIGERKGKTPFGTTWHTEKDYNNIDDNIYDMIRCIAFRLLTNMG
jgi:hypothetical protein